MYMLVVNWFVLMGRCDFEKSISDNGLGGFVCCVECLQYLSENNWRLLQWRCSS